MGLSVDKAEIKLHVNALSVKEEPSKNSQPNIWSSTSLAESLMLIRGVLYESEAELRKMKNPDWWFFAAYPRISNQLWWAERSHLPILGADAHMLSTFIQTDLVDLHWTLWRHNIIASFFVFFRGKPISLWLTFCQVKCHKKVKSKSMYGCTVPYESMHRVWC